MDKVEDTTFYVTRVGYLMEDDELHFYFNNVISPNTRSTLQKEDKNVPVFYVCA